MRDTVQKTDLPQATNSVHTFPIYLQQSVSHETLHFQTKSCLFSDGHAEQYSQLYKVKWACGFRGWGGRSVVEGLPSRCKAQDLISSTPNKHIDLGVHYWHSVGAAKHNDCLSEAASYLGRGDGCIIGPLVSWPSFLESSWCNRKPWLPSTGEALAISVIFPAMCKHWRMKGTIVPWWESTLGSTELFAEKCHYKSNTHLLPL